MPNNSLTEIAKRRLALILLIAAEDGSTTTKLIEDLRSVANKRTVQSDLRWLKSTFPDRMKRESAKGKSDSGRVIHRWVGPIPHQLADPLTLLAENELLALVAARGLLSRRDTTLKAVKKSPDTTDQGDGLADAIHGLLKRIGVTGHANELERSVVSVSRFGAAPIITADLTACLTAVTTGYGLTFGYTNLEGDLKRQHVWPRRMVLIRNEWYCVAWSGKLRMYRLARMSEVVTIRHQPEGCPASIHDNEVDSLLAGSFYATNGGKRERVQLAISPGAVPFVADRSWGDKTTLVPAPDLGEGWMRLSFITYGLSECRYWVMGMGTGVIPEHPPHLVEWIASEARGIIEGLGQGKPT